MPILKQLALGSSQAKRRSRLDLTAEMISAPLGDFRHTMHVGRGGDAFGDTSFLSSRSGEAPPLSPRPGLLSRTFRSSKRSQSVTRVDRPRENPPPPPGGSPPPVKSAMSLPLLSDEDGGRGGRAGTAGGLTKSLSSGSDGRPANGLAPDLEQEERSFGELTDLPTPSGPRPGPMRRTESVMSFHVDLGPSMLGDVLNVMEKEEEDDLGFEEGGVSPPLSAREEGDEAEDKGEEEGEEQEEEEEEEEEGDSLQPPLRPPSAEEAEDHSEGPCAPESQPNHHREPDTCSASSSGSAPPEEIPPGQLQGGETDCANLSPAQGEGETFSFMEEEEEDDEIRV